MWCPCGQRPPKVGEEYCHLCLAMQREFEAALRAEQERLKSAEYVVLVLIGFFLVALVLFGAIIGWMLNAWWN